MATSDFKDALLQIPIFHSSAEIISEDLNAHHFLLSHLEKSNIEDKDMKNNSTYKNIRKWPSDSTHNVVG